MEKGSTNPFQGEQDPEQFLPDEQNKNQSTYATQPRNHCTFVHHGVTTKDAKRPLWSYTLTQNR